MNEKRARAMRWIRHSYVPTLPGMRFALGGHNYGGALGETSAYDKERNVIRWQGPLRSPLDRADLMHEVGHGFSTRFTPEDWARIRRLSGSKNRNAPLTWGDMPGGQRDIATKGRQPFEETFADLYSNLARQAKGYHALRQLLQEIAARPRT